MAPKYLALIFFIWITGAFMGQAMDGGQPGMTELTCPAEQECAEKTTLDKILIWKNVKFEDVGDTFSVISATKEFFSGIFEMLFFKFSFLENNPYADAFRWIILGPLLIAVIWGMVVTLIGVFSRVFSF